eukprot:TRINITY_DN6142_c0_g1_i3.p1 TRINITY_DN6142_c0_g1~~TRINITY_DN6142_c0_g1_i3.p1  ORF type:complete len:311 (+),score=52.28 TRINITY_DN6142_c0_g1_i3:114-1046(+)
MHIHQSCVGVSWGLILVTIMLSWTHDAAERRDSCSEAEHMNVDELLTGTSELASTVDTLAAAADIEERISKSSVLKALKVVRKPSDADHTHSSQPSDELDAAQREKVVRKPSDADHTHSSQPSDELDAAQREKVVRKPSDADHTHSSQPSDELDAAQREKTTNEFHAISRDDNVITLADLEHYYFEVRKFKRGYQLEAEMKEMVETYGDSGTINLQQYLNMEATQMKEELSPEDLEAMFKYLDADNDGSLSAADLKEAQQVIGTDLAGRMQQMMQELIGEQDGVISLEEFKKWMMLDQDKTMKSQNTADS